LGVEQLHSLLYLELESAEVNKVSSNVRDGKINEHSSDLGGLLFSSKSFNILVDELSYLTLVVRVVWSDTWEEMSSLLVVLDNLRRKTLNLDWNALGKSWCLAWLLLQELRWDLLRRLSQLRLAIRLAWH
jgi:hypothetical protein